MEVNADKKEKAEDIIEVINEDKLFEDKHKLSFKTLPIYAKIAAIIAAVLVVIYIAGIITFSFIFKPGTTINGIDVSLKTANQSHELIKNSVDNYKLIIQLRNNRSVTITGNDADASYDKNADLSELLKEQNKFNWISSLFPGYSSKLNTQITYNESKLDSVLNEFLFLKESNMKAPVDAHIAYNAKKEKFYIAKEDNGTTLNVDKTKEVIKTAFADAQSSINLEKKGLYTNAQITSSDKSLSKNLDLYNKYCCKKITYIMGDNTRDLDGSIIMNWYTFDSDGNASYDKAKVSEWVNAFASEIDTAGSVRNFTSPNGQAYTVSGGTYGWQLDKEQEVASIIQLLDGGENQKREPIMKSKAKAYVTKGQPDWGDTYAEVNLTTQHMYMVKNGQVVFETDIISGLPTSAKETPTGVYSCLEKKQNKTLVGNITANGTPEYETPVAYWMRITWGGVGFHTATWQSSFGGQLYKTRGSHGCINMSYSDSQTLYGLIEVGDPIIIHK